MHFCAQCWLVTAFNSLVLLDSVGPPEDVGSGPRCSMIENTGNYDEKGTTRDHSPIPLLFAKIITSFVRKDGIRSFCLEVEDFPSAIP